MSETKRVAEERISWEELQQLMDEDTVLSVQVKGVVNAGVITYVQGVRAFIPASQLSLSIGFPFIFRFIVPFHYGVIVGATIGRPQRKFVQ